MDGDYEKDRAEKKLLVKLQEAEEAVADDNAEAARKTVDEIYKSFEDLQEFPAMGADLSKRVSFRTDYKYLVHGVYITLYLIEKDWAEVYRVIDRCQDITGILFR